ncbi:MAG: zf-HC2 domain-containing protein [Lachnospiraceae bacterium]|nr:zf-HC2 domain-containing protein [Lachnospiraceae bacterium]
MNCKEFEKHIPRYQEDKLSIGELSAFLAHLGECPVCQEELAIHYLINDGILRLEEGGAFDLQQIMNDHRERSINQLRKRRIWNRVVYGLEVLIVILVAVLVFLILF